MTRAAGSTGKLRRRVVVAVSGLAVAAAMTVTQIHPAGAHIHRGEMTHVSNMPPFPVYYGAIAYGHDGSNGKAWRHLSKAQAKQRALELCGADTCAVVSVFTRCGAVAHDGAKYHGGYGYNRSAAEAHAMANVGGGRIVDWACN
ncbi:MAG: DUF4189 domain-containing protein [Mycobacterium pseudokansasii]|uniref:DUF4189 domain-containing protein n=1 Tax=Mycobacterium pseudokansasii TaxID=2341080 RepID=A0A498R346_9MYCO|nr:DUF4189 domain-containing protein [Mycobacterium pseudokansasii]MBY0391530.1 DUF4189 domain-containing protein [Mycobacterium pseudokansasii]VBA30890.1 hypothetical protein LAUMK35_04882 [Mycobacterium pseudokansasii]VBA32818.1 hypothetical protein LAUMK21_04872 [Mycobacterium pseudokansasii]VBA54756.1 hypothetical protein LAUMK142_04786 [Mycobacterium pseudokansasii]